MYLKDNNIFEIFRSILKSICCVFYLKGYLEFLKRQEYPGSFSAQLANV